MTLKPSRARTITSSASLAVALSTGLLGIHGCGSSDAPDGTGSAGAGGRLTGSAGHAGQTQAGSGGSSPSPSGGSGAGGATGGSMSTGGSSSSSGGAGGAAGSAALGGSPGSAGGGGASHAGSGGQGAGGKGQAGGGATAGAAGSTGTGTCTASKPASANASGSGPHKVTVETNGDSGIKEGTIYRPTDLGGSEKYPIFVWGNGACSQDGLSNTAAMAEIASHGYFVVADGTPNGSGSRSMNTSDIAGMGKPLLAYVAWAVAESDKPCSAYYQSLDVTKIASNGFSCGGLMAEGTAGDSRITTWGLNSS